MAYLEACGFWTHKSQDFGHNVTLQVSTAFFFKSNSVLPNNFGVSCFVFGGFFILFGFGLFFFTLNFPSVMALACPDKDSLCNGQPCQCML